MTWLDRYDAWASRNPVAWAAWVPLVIGLGYAFAPDWRGPIMTLLVAHVFGTRAQIRAWSSVLEDRDRRIAKLERAAAPMAPSSAPETVDVVLEREL